MSLESPDLARDTRRRQLVWFLRILGGLDLIALLAVVMPFSAMNWMHYTIGLGEMPDAPLMGYLARSASMLYAFLGGLVLYMSFDVDRYRPVLDLIGRIVLVCGVILIGIDLAERLPLWWICLEGPTVLGLGGVLLWLLRRSRPENA
jgi:hypothetical protein